MLINVSDLRPDDFLVKTELLAQLQIMYEKHIEIIQELDKIIAANTIYYRSNHRYDQREAAEAKEAIETAQTQKQKLISEQIVLKKKLGFKIDMPVSDLKINVQEIRTRQIEYIKKYAIPFPMPPRIWRSGR